MAPEIVSLAIDLRRRRRGFNEAGALMAPEIDASACYGVKRSGR